jgi:hypothetical protein
MFERDDFSVGRRAEGHSAAVAPRSFDHPKLNPKHGRAISDASRRALHLGGNADHR